MGTYIILRVQDKDALRPVRRGGVGDGATASLQEVSNDSYM